MSSFDAAMGKVEAMLSNAQEALRDLPEVSGFLDTADLTDGQRQAIHRRLEPIRKVQMILNQAGVESEGPGGSTWEDTPRRLGEEPGGVGSEGGGGSTW
jgi:hypothetical protein